MDENCPHVVIIGSGLAGLAAAELLSTCKEKVRVTILEANNRVGGRIFTRRLQDNSPIELGAQWFHGKVGNPLYDIAAKSDIATRKSSYNDRFYTENETIAEQSVGDSANDYFSSILERIYDRQLDDVPEHIQNVGQFLDVELKKYLDDIQDNFARAVSAKVFRYRDREESHTSGCSTLHDVHLRDFGEYLELEGGDLAVIGGYDKVLQTIIDRIPKEVIRLNQMVVKIKSSDNNELNVECSDGNVYKADIVICTVSLGILKNQAKVLFQPNLPAKKLDVIDRLAFGVVNKVIFYYEKPFWPKNQFRRLVFLWNDEIDDKNCGCKLPLEDDELWLKHVSSAHIILPCPNALLFWFVGEDAIRVEKLSEKQLSSYLTRVLKKFIVDKTIQEPDIVIRTKWHEDPYVRGSYSYVNTNACGKDIDVLAEPILDYQGRPLILFAGEATDRSYYSTAHGAYLSGQREANRILDTLQLEKKIQS
ncbi:uncharacterized protein TRIADDRAFT_31591 [Trichoplax adhaerens]|uniref:Amine oxidase n=1 Tax=Trichoplax adhaerens TaxID=10228 RepID=B3S9I2_TRIAD|nr:hypothetical protein TRIADDRAFT_31591 [Trichoplax adhaerens]EDV20657.1 hypothetical protein TRIADDRAFT_31591 [Trichoplax adhaerens]|eukprot:XP_002116857.1 hypothetical protein TRIADDRAFT_31591 [Trichoplax adhaerens]